MASSGFIFPLQKQILKSTLLTMDPNFTDSDVGAISRLYDEVDPVSVLDGP
jgi:hypothetical protein